MNDSRIFDISTKDEFEHLALEIFRYQYDNTQVYREFCDHLRTSPHSVNSIDQIPFLPIEFFKSRKVLAETMDVVLHFKSSGTTGAVTSNHYVADPELYRQSFNLGFRKFYGTADQYCILALLPSYLERKDSSLVYMVQHLIEQSPFEESGFYLSELDLLARHLQQLNESGIKVILFGVTFALLELAHQFKFPLRNTIVIETGGMKGRRKEMVREEVHKINPDMMFFVFPWEGHFPEMVARQLCTERVPVIR